MTPQTDTSQVTRPGPSQRPSRPVEEITSGTLLDERYRLGPILGRGGMGIVYAGHDEVAARDVAVKVFSGSDSPCGLLRFMREARVAMQFSHPNVVRVVDAGALGYERRYLVMERFAGRTLKEKMDAEGALPVELVHSIALQLFAALTEVHRQGVCHRDIKPGNVLVADDGETTKLIDFGLCRSDADLSSITAQGTVVGTPAYMAPEQIFGEECDGRADIYSLGVTLHSALAGVRPFMDHGRKTSELMQASLLQPLPNLYGGDAGVTPALDAVIARATEKVAEHRFQSIGDFQTAWVSALDQ